MCGVVWGCAPQFEGSPEGAGVTGGGETVGWLLTLPVCDALERGVCARRGGGKGDRRALNTNKLVAPLLACLVGKYLCWVLGRERQTGTERELEMV